MDRHAAANITAFPAAHTAHTDESGGARTIM
jgi:hypothetical protein